MTKKCTKCKEFKELTEFGKKLASKNGLFSICKSCRKKSQQTPEARISQKKARDCPKSKNYQKEFREKPENIQTRAEWQNKNKNKEKERQRSPKAKLTRSIRRKSSEGKLVLKKYLSSEKAKETTKKWKQQDKINNPGKNIARNANRKAGKRKRTPKWLTRHHRKQIEDFYILTKELQWLCEEKLHVDHIIPLHGQNICGLHVPWNLQIICESDNLSKHNSFDGTYDNSSWKK